MDPHHQVDLHAIRQRIGAGDVYDGGRRASVPGPGHSLKDRSLSLWVSEGGRVVWHSFANDDPSEVWRHLGLGRGEGRQVSRAEAERLKRERERQRRAELKIRLDFCAAIWRETQGAAGSPVETYLRGRGIIGPIPKALRFHPSAPMGYADPARPQRTFPAMVAIVTARDGKSAAGLHVTALRPDGAGKAALDNPRRMFGDMIGAAVQLSPVPVGGDLAVGEGIETALSYRDLTGTPCWAALSTSGLRNFSPPPGIKRLVVAADADDAKGEGVEAARALAERASRHCGCVVHAAPPGMDWANVLQEARP